MLYLLGVQQTFALFFFFFYKKRHICELIQNGRESRAGLESPKIVRDDWDLPTSNNTEKRQHYPLNRGSVKESGFKGQ